jgi:hypothetical protein
MKLLRVELRNYRGVVERDVAFSPTGVTVVEGPNEIGKSSIAEAIDRVLEDLDSTSRKRVVELRPVGRDVGPEVAIEVETGPYAFRFRKRFLRERLTELSITRPQPRQLAGREAHDRVRSMLAETVDLALWKALRIQQGGMIDQASLVDQASLSAALDRAAGEAPAGQEEHSLFDAARNEYLLYWTETGRRKQEAGERDRALEGARAEVARIEAELRQIDADVDASVRLQAEAARLAEQRLKQLVRVDELVAEQQRVSRLEAAVNQVQARKDAAILAAGQARRNHAGRLAAIKELKAAAAHTARLTAETEDATPGREAAEVRAAAAVQTLEGARGAYDEALRFAETVREDLSLRRDERDLADLVRRKAKVDAALTELEAAQEVLSINGVDEAALESIETLHLAVAQGRSRLEAHRPLVRLEALAPIDGTIDGMPYQLASGDELDRRVEQTLALTVPNVLSLTVAAGVDADPSASRLRPDEERLAQLCRQAGAVDVPAARRLHKLHRQAEQIRAEQRRVLQDNLEELTPEALGSRLVVLRAKVAAYLQSRGLNRPSPPTRPPPVLPLPRPTSRSGRRSGPDRPPSARSIQPGNCSRSSRRRIASVRWSFASRERRSRISTERSSPTERRSPTSNWSGSSTVRRPTNGTWRNSCESSANSSTTRAPLRFRPRSRTLRPRSIASVRNYARSRMHCSKCRPGSATTARMGWPNNSTRPPRRWRWASTTASNIRVVRSPGRSCTRPCATNARRLDAPTLARSATASTSSGASCSGLVSAWSSTTAFGSLAGRSTIGPFHTRASASVPRNSSASSRDSRAR